MAEHSNNNNQRAKPRKWGGSNPNKDDSGSVGSAPIAPAKSRPRSRGHKKHASDDDDDDDDVGSASSAPPRKSHAMVPRINSESTPEGIHDRTHANLVSASKWKTKKKEQHQQVQTAVHGAADSTCTNITTSSKMFMPRRTLSEQNDEGILDRTTPHLAHASKWKSKKKKQQEDTSNHDNHHHSTTRDANSQEQLILNRTTPNLASADKWKSKKMAKEQEKLHQQPYDDNVSTDEKNHSTRFDQDRDDADHDNNNKSLKKKKKLTKKQDGSPCALAPNEHSIVVPDHKRTRGKVDWSTVRENLDQLTLKSEKYVQKRQTLAQKLQQSEQDKAQQLADIRQAFQTDKDHLDEARRQSRNEYKQHLEELGDMTHEDLCGKATELQQIIQTLKKSNTKHRNEIEGHDKAIRQLVKHNAKLLLAVEQSTNIVNKLQEHKGLVELRHEQLTRTILPSYKQRLAELKDGLAECKAHSRVEERGRIRCGNFILKVMRMVIASDQCEEDFQLDLADLAGGCEGGTLPPLEVEEEEYDDNIIDDNIDDLAKNRMPGKDSSGSYIGDDSSVKGAAVEDNIGTKEVVEEKSVWERYSGGESAGATASRTSSNIPSTSSLKPAAEPEATGSGLLKPAHQDLLQAATRASSFQNGAVILSDSDSDNESDSSDYGSDSD